jgi:serine protease
VFGNANLNPLFASALIPLVLTVLLLNSSFKWFAIGSSIGVAACLGISAFSDPGIWLLGSGAIASSYLLINAMLCLGLAYLASQKNSFTEVNLR